LASQVGEVEGHTLEVGAVEIGANQHLFGVVHRGQDWGHRGQERQHECGEHDQQAKQGLGLERWLER
jgi:hypothetical protein